MQNVFLKTPSKEAPKKTTTKQRSEAKSQDKPIRKQHNGWEMSPREALLVNFVDQEI